MPKLHTVCLRPGGMNRGGARHEGHKTFEIEAFTPAQLRELIAEPNIAAIVGGDTLANEHVAAMEAKATKVEKVKN